VSGNRQSPLSLVRDGRYLRRVRHTGRSGFRGGAIAALLALTLLLTALLAGQAIYAVHSHRQTAEGVLREYAEFAASELVRRATQELTLYAFAPTLRRLATVGVDRVAGPVPSPDSLRPGADDYERSALDVAGYTFRVALADSVLVSSQPSATEPWIRDTVLRHVALSVKREWPLAVVTVAGDSEPRLLVFRVAKSDDGLPVAAYGFGADRGQVGALVGRAVARAPLLPPSLTAEVPYDSLVSIRVTDGLGGSLYETDLQYPPTFAGDQAFGDHFGGLLARVALHPDLASNLVIGGLPGSRLPVIGGLLALAAALMLVAISLLRREQQLARLRTEFVSNVSHELRTPLAQIRLFAETLLLGRVRSEAERERSLAVIDTEARRLTHLVENVLQFSRTERHGVRIAPEPTSLSELAHDVVERFRPLAEPEGVRLRTRVDQGLEARVDRGAVQQILLNLLDNAVKYGPAGQTVTLGGEARDGGVQLWVEDEGPGIPRGDRERVFDRFTRLDGNGERRVAGAGIGLSVVRDLVERHGGRVWVEEGAGRGARFVLAFPASPVAL